MAFTWTTQLGLLIEGAATNSIVQSQDLTQTAWANTGNNTLGAAFIAADNTTSAIPITVTASPFPAMAQTFSVTSGTAYSFSAFFVFLSGNPFVAFELNDLSNGQATAFLNLVTGLSGGSVASAGKWTINSTSIVPCFNNWFRLAVNATPAFTSSNVQFRFYQSAVATVTNPSTTIGSKMSGWGAQQEASSTLPTSYFPTTTVAAARAADVVVITVANNTYDILVEDTAGGAFRNGVVIGGGTYTLVPRANQLHVTRVRFWPSSGVGSLTAVQKAALAP